MSIIFIYRIITNLWNNYRLTDNYELQNYRFSFIEILNNYDTGSNIITLNSQLRVPSLQFRKRVFGNDLEEKDIESDNEKNKKDAKNEIKTIIKTIDFKFSLNYNEYLLVQIIVKFILTKWLNSIYKSRQATAQIRNSGKLSKDLCRKKLCRIKAAKELFRKNNSNITNYNKKLLLRMLADRTFHLSEISDTGEEDNSKTVVNVYELSNDL
ncbi:hypothetical protein Glove_321g48 [Diversispora epigaea]|uniref:Uncharacterized protein n=1 Tax=Diversispora epigaea TaxID=1348612 RepID=A0A397HNC0_9GLOM|nr:hypothetical protein Glove_321g48 [Diversispora epigaea]